jgi:hypothetical protein
MPQRIADDLGVGARVIDQHDGVAVFGIGEAVVTRP